MSDRRPDLPARLAVVRVAGKPHIRILAGGGGPLGTWVCFGYAALGIGFRPAEAFDAMLDYRRRTSVILWDKA